IVAKVGLAGAVGLVATLVAPTMLPLALVAAGGAFAAPDLLLARAAKARIRRADRAIPEFLDLLSAASSAGLAPPSAIRRASSGLEGPLAEELEAAAASVCLGARWRDELQGIADRLKLPDLQAAVTVIARTESL